MEEKTYLSYEEILQGIKELSYSQGFYGRLYRNIMEDTEVQEKFKNLCEKHKFTDMLDFILYIEG